MTDADLRQRLQGDAVPALAYEEDGGKRLDRTAAHLNALLNYGRLMSRLQLVVAFFVGVGATLFVALHTAPPQLLLRKVLFAYLFLPLYWLLFILSLATRKHFEANDLIMRIQLVLI